MCLSCFRNVRFLTVFDDFYQYDFDTCRFPGRNFKKAKNSQNTCFLRVFNGPIKIWDLALTNVRGPSKMHENVQKWQKHAFFVFFMHIYAHLCTHFCHRSKLRNS